MSARKLVLENRLGQRIRVLDVAPGAVSVLYRLDTRRVEISADLEALDAQGVEYRVLKTLNARDLDEKGLSLPGIGRLRPHDGEKAPLRTVPALPEEDDQKRLSIILKKTSMGHAAAVIALIALSWVVSRMHRHEEPQTVTIAIPKPVEAKPVPKVAVSEKKIVPQKTKIAKVAQKTVVKPVSKPQPKVAARRVPAPTRRVVHTEKPRDLNNVGALAALGGLKNGSKGAMGLDSHSMKNIRSAGTGAGGGGVGGLGGGGVPGVMPGTGLIAGSAGRGGRAQGAGGYGTKGVGGGRAGYGQISLVGNTGGISLPLEDEATVEGGLNIDQIKAVIDRNKGQVTYCYEQGLLSQSDLRGRVSISFVIGASGRVNVAKVADTSLGSKQVEDCIVGRMKTWQFPKPVGRVNVDVLYPFELRRVTSR